MAADGPSIVSQLEQAEARVRDAKWKFEEAQQDAVQCLLHVASVDPSLAQTLSFALSQRMAARAPATWGVATWPQQTCDASMGVDAAPWRGQPQQQAWAPPTCNAAAPGCYAAQRAPPATEVGGGCSGKSGSGELGVLNSLLMEAPAAREDLSPDRDEALLRKLLAQEGRQAQQPSDRDGAMAARVLGTLLDEPSRAQQETGEESIEGGSTDDVLVRTRQLPDEKLVGAKWQENDRNRPRRFTSDDTDLGDSSGGDSEVSEATTPPITTLALQQLPPRWSRQKLVEDLGARGFRSTFDFLLHSPAKRGSSRAQSGARSGQALINFRSALDANRFVDIYDGLKVDEDSAAAKALVVRVADTQGLDANIVAFCLQHQGQSLDVKRLPLVFLRSDEGIPLHLESLPSEVKARIECQLRGSLESAPGGRLSP